MKKDKLLYTAAGALTAAALGIGTLALAQTTDTTNSSTTDSLTPSSSLQTTSQDTTSTGADTSSTTSANTSSSTNTTTGTGSNTTTQRVSTVSPTQVYPAPMEVWVDDTGNALVRGVIESVNADSITINSWGGIWTISTATGGTVIPAGTTGMGTFSGIHVGDFIGALGTVAPGQSFAINAVLVRDWTTNPYIPGGSTGSSANNTSGSNTSGTNTTSSNNTPTSGANTTSTGTNDTTGSMTSPTNTSGANSTNTGTTNTTGTTPSANTSSSY